MEASEDVRRAIYKEVLKDAKITICCDCQRTNLQLQQYRRGILFPVSDVFRCQLGGAIQLAMTNTQVRRELLPIIGPKTTLDLSTNPPHDVCSHSVNNSGIVLDTIASMPALSSFKDLLHQIQRIIIEHNDANVSYAALEPYLTCDKVVKVIVNFYSETTINKTNAADILSQLTSVFSLQGLLSSGRICRSGQSASPGDGNVLDYWQKSVARVTISFNQSVFFSVHPYGASDPDTSISLASFALPGSVYATNKAIGVSDRWQDP
jgi:hypothetical protein